MNKTSIKKYIYDVILITIGTFIMAIAISFFLLPNQLSSGGFVGVATVIYYFYKLSLGTVVFVLNVPLFIVAFLKLGKVFFSKAVIGTFLLSVFINLLEKFSAVTTDRLLACIYGGIIMGIGLAIVFKANASTGGVDLITNIIKAFRPHSRQSQLLVFIDGIVILLNVIAFQEIEIGLYSAITIYLSSKLIDIIFEGIYYTKMVYIISNKSQEIADKIIQDVERGITGLEGKGMYKQEEKVVLMCIISRNQLMKVKEIVKSIDSNAFVVISNAREALGLGFKD